ncbi:hypothetical protein Cch01nite_11040 [Cellulomonas chitinilytica]|uniref:Prepilin-type N-terminal cleavage/methylation domain-containing protein n=1 Tax=Cellulomonas chitinilytica TaxID=398759 RepID=A0A919P0F4_9CELL|nr:prepilin-type N-terminal cleavage/methylation domain-containing protein [Cellulomonas chitinilytica]GIG20380.1 hypothetical protein Cch01nite_11040 [Cellulomonas chitinilytica]
MQVRRARLERWRDDDSGFTLMELLVAMMIITVVLLSLMVVQTSALVTNAQSRQRTQATAVANQVMEELRALPWLVLSKGMSTSFLAAGGPDTNVVGGKLHPTVNLAIDETLVTASDQAMDKLPLSGPGGTNKMVDTDPAIPGVRFTSRTYVTRSASTDGDVVTLSVITSWSANKTGKLRQVLVRSEAYAPSGGCGDASNQPFLGACQALFTGSASASGATTTVTASSGSAPAGPTPVQPLLPGSDYTLATVTGGQAGIGITSQQSTTVDSTVLHAGSTLAKADPTVAPLQDGGTKLSNASSNDVGSSGAAPSSPPDVGSTGVTSPLVLSSGNLALNLLASGSRVGLAKASMAASCASGIPAGQGCGASTLTGGTGSSVVLTVDGTTFTGASVAGGGSAKAYGGRFTTAGGAIAVGCATLTGPGCTAAVAERSLGNAAFGVGPWAGGAAPSGLATVTSYTDSVRVERGLSQRTGDATSARSAQVAYWNGTGYTTLVVGTTTSSTVTTPSVTWTAGASTVQAAVTVTVTPAMSIKSNPDPAACGLEGCTIDADTGTITVTVTWTVAGQTLTSSTSLGTSHVSAAFKAAPSA